MKLVLGAAVLAAIALGASACGSSHAKDGGPTNGSTVSSSGLMLNGTVRCTATLPSPAQAGHDLGVVFTFQNVSKHPAKVDLAYGGMWVLVKSPDGTTYDSRVPLEAVSGPYVPPTPIAPGGTKTETLRNIRARWGGPLRITPGCGLSALHPVQVAVTSPGLPVSETAAVSEVVAATGHLLEHCRPRTSGVSVVGQIDPPTGGNAPPMQARCSVTLRREGGFYDAQVLVTTPPTLRSVHVEPPYEGLSAAYVPHHNTEAIAWEFVVTRHGATSVNSASSDTTRPGGGLFRSWDWTGSEWQEGDRSLCGGSDGSGLGVNGPNVVFVSLCGR
jgi:hypothetical protein